MFIRVFKFNDYTRGNIGDIIINVYFIWGLWKKFYLFILELFLLEEFNLRKIFCFFDLIMGDVFLSLVKNEGK